MNNTKEIYRRSAITSVGAICLTTAFTPVLGADLRLKGSSLTLSEDSQTKYFRPLFKEQSQPWPGLVNKMDSIPDPGEKSYKSSRRLKSIKTVITGGDSGMRRAGTGAYAREGSQAAIKYCPTKDEEDAPEVIQLIKMKGRRAVVIPVDLRDESFCSSLVKKALKSLGLAIVVNNAARQQTRFSILDISTAGFDATMKTNIYALFWIITAAIPHLKPRSSILGTSFVQAYAPTEDLYYHAQTKAATIDYIKSIAKQLAPKAIRVKGAAPAPIWTSLQVSDGGTMEKLKQFGSQAPWKDQVSRQNLLLFIYSLQHLTQYIPPDKLTVPAQGKAP